MDEEVEYILANLNDEIEKIIIDEENTMETTTKNTAENSEFDAFKPILKNKLEEKVRELAYESIPNDHEDAFKHNVEASLVDWAMQYVNNKTIAACNFHVDIIDKCILKIYAGYRFENSEWKIVTVAIGPENAMQKIEKTES